ncbi:hypothetical protein ACJJIW_11730 [Microbulbifer sp. JMSA004]|uniref:Tse2 family ADP-ribosyltransferase toxin n=1 Tax=Microbulbifer sp. JMSA004 TaxID=3243370 RepID=UPI0040398B6D
MVPKEDLYIMDVGEFTTNLYRMGNAEWPKFDEARARIDVMITKRDGVEVVIANGNGFSAFDHLTKMMRKPGKKIWKIKKGVRIPNELKLVEDKRPGHEGHYMIAPETTMPLKKYLGLLEEFGLDRSKVVKLDGKEIENVG